MRRRKKRSRDGMPIIVRELSLLSTHTQRSMMIAPPGWLVFGICLISSNAAAFQPSRLISRTAGLKTSTDHNPPRRPTLVALDSRDEEDSAEASERRLYQERRRQMLLSMLAVASGSPLLASQRSALAKEIETGTTKATGAFDLIIPPLDDREYSVFVLDNGLRVLLCSDDSSNQAGAALDVHVGACSDPESVPGLAHFCEHMTFLGSKKYPKESDFEAFLATNGGVSNAFTDSGDTVYYFTMEAEADRRLAEGLSRFGSLFSSPLFTESATNRELNAIESENAKNLQSDTFRNFQILKARANQKHPFSKFFTGNKKTLLDDTLANGIDLRAQLVAFHKKYYSANQMTLAVVGPQPLKKLKEMVEAGFSDIPNRKRGKPEEKWADVLPFTEDNTIIPSFRHTVEIVPVQDLRQVTIAWPILYRTDKQRIDSLLYKPANYVAHLLGHEGPSSLLSYLKQQGWANSIGAGSEDTLSDFEVFDVVVGLTPQGLKAIDKIVETVYSYLEMLRSRVAPDYVFDEVLQLDELQWRFLTKGDTGGYVQSLATAMQRYPPPLYVAGPRRLALDEYAADPPLTDNPRPGFPARDQLERTRNEVQRFSESLTVDNAMVTVMSKSFESRADRKEKWYGTDYSVRKIPSEVLDKWRNPEEARNFKLDFPKPNQFIPSEAGLRRVLFPAERVEKASKRTFQSRMKPITRPRVIRDDGSDGRWTVYYKPDDRFGKPQGYVVFQVLTREAYDSPSKAALATLFELCVSDRLVEYAYDAGLAGLTYEVRVLPRGIRLTFGGYNDKLKKFAVYVSRKLSKDIRDLLPKSDVEFDRKKDQVMRALSAFDVKQPYAHASYYGQLALQPRRFQYANKDLRDAARKTTLPDLVDYAGVLWSSGKGLALVQGNFDETEALDLVTSIGDILPFKSIPENQIPDRLHALQLPTSMAKDLPPRLLVAEPNLSNENSVSYVTLQSLGQSEREHVMLELLAAIIEEPFYNELRTQRQLGYIVSSGVRGIGDSRTYSFIVQSSIAPADSLTLEILRFLDTVEEKLLKPLPKGDFAVYIKSLVDRKTEPDKDLAVEVTRNWSEISSGRLQFDRIQREAASLLAVGKEDVIEFWREIYAGDSRRVLVTEMIPRRGIASSSPPETSTGYSMRKLGEPNLLLGIDDIEQFRRDRDRLV